MWDIPGHLGDCPPPDPGFAAGSAAKDVYTFDAHGLVTGDGRYLNEGGGWSLPATTAYTFKADSGRYDNGGRPRPARNLMATWNRAAFRAPAPRAGRLQVSTG